MDPGKTLQNKRKHSQSRTRRKVSFPVWIYIPVGLVMLGIFAVLAAHIYFSRDLPSVDSLRNYKPQQTTRVYDRNGQLIGNIFNERRTVIPLSEVPRHIVLAILAAEDANFYEHEGLDYRGIIRAILKDMRKGHIAQGGSTITQQVVKLNLLSSKRTLSRKVRELILSRKLENKLSKDEILYLYLNHVNFGHGRYGIQEAAKYYYGKDASELTLAEAAMLAGIPQAPARLSPRRNYQAAAKKQRYVLSQLLNKREAYWPDLSPKEIEAARTENVTPIPLPESIGQAPEILSIAKRTLRELVGKDALVHGGYEIYTTIDLNLQAKSRHALQHGLEVIDERHGYQGPAQKRKRPSKPSPEVDSLRMGKTYIATVTGTNDTAKSIDLDVAGHTAILPMHKARRYNPDHYKASEFAKPGDLLPVSITQFADGDTPAVTKFERGPEGAVVIIDPRSRGILALVGGYAASSGLNRATQAIRQPGSAFKPIVYARAIQMRRFTPASLVLDAPAVYDEWKPQNYNRKKYRGEVRLRQGLAQSINLVAVRVTEDIGAHEVASFARQLGLTTPLAENMSLSLGASSVKPVELTNAFATFVAGGRWEPTHIIDKIIAPNGEPLQLPETELARDVMKPNEAYIVTSMLQSVITEGTGSAAKELQSPLAGKTGTSSSSRDLWFVGYSPSVVASVWIGFDDSRSIGKRETGARSALPIWMNVMKAASESIPPSEFTVPNGVLITQIDPDSGLLAYENQEDAIQEVFLVGTSPTEVARRPDVAAPNAFMMEQFETHDTNPQSTPTPDERVLDGLAPP